mgnify:CR=1 FL=1
MARATSAESAERVDHLQGMILAGEPNTACLQYARQTWGVSRAQGYKLIKRAWRQIHDDIEGPDLDRQEMLAWCVQTLIETAGQAKAQRNQERWWLLSASLIRCEGWGSTHQPGTESTVRGSDVTRLTEPKKGWLGHAPEAG